MLKRIATKFIPILLSACATLVAAQTTGIVYPQLLAGTTFPKSGVKVGDNAVYASTGVFAGDMIQTGAMAARVAFDGASVQVAPNSALLLSTVPEFVFGSAVIATNKATTLYVSNREIALLGPGILRIDNNGRMLAISVQLGTATIKEDGIVTRLVQGDSVTRALQTTSGSSPQEKPTASPADSQTPSPAISGPLIGKKTFWFLTGGVAAAGVTAGILATRGEGPVSPSRPF